jgi:NET1-associated nuclear protein 1 (U3 small nucleolar RNA-associated protein 17)
MGNGDWYPPYNKPIGLIDFMEKAPPEEEWLVLLDPDAMYRQPIMCPGGRGPAAERQPPSLTLPCKRGQPISWYSEFLDGASNELALRYLPNVEPRNDTNGGQPKGRRADMVGGFHVVHRDDISQYMHEWLNISASVRFDPDVRPTILLAHTSVDLYGIS